MAYLATPRQIVLWVLAELAADMWCCLPQFVLGESGVVLMLIILFMAVTSAGSAEMVAVSSLFTYDIYKVQFCPNRPSILFTIFLSSHFRDLLPPETHGSVL